MNFSMGSRRERARLVDQADGLSLRAGPGGAADAVDIVLGVLREVVVDDVAHLLDVQAARGHVGADHDRELAALEIVEDLEALSLLHVAGDDPAWKAVGVQPLMEAPRFARC